MASLRLTIPYIFMVRKKNNRIVFINEYKAKYPSKYLFNK